MGHTRSNAQPMSKNGLLLLIVGLAVLVAIGILTS
jgi:hypothetical protein